MTTRADLAQRLKAEPGEFAMLFAPATKAELAARNLADKPPGYIAGWASSGNVNCYGYRVAPDAFDDSIAERGFTGPKGIRLLAHHDWQAVAGVIEVLERKGDKLWIEAQLELEISYVKDLHLQCKAVGGLNFSVGFRATAWEENEADDDCYLTITRATLMEVSVVTFPAQDDAEMTHVNTAPKPVAVKTLAEFEKRLVALGLAKSRNDANRLAQEVKRHAHLFGAPVTPEVPPVPTAPPVPADLQSLADRLAAMRAILSS
jgi:HK97 family phage prohead protease